MTTSDDDVLRQLRLKNFALRRHIIKLERELELWQRLALASETACVDLLKLIEKRNQEKTGLTA